MSSLPTDPAILDQVKLPADTSGPTARDRFTAHSTNGVCHSCHQFLDPFGFVFENFDPIGQRGGSGRPVATDGVAVFQVTE